jgi:hypothetical protein
LGKGNTLLRKLKNPRLLPVAGFSVWNSSSADHRHILFVGDGLKKTIKAGKLPGWREKTFAVRRLIL